MISLIIGGSRFVGPLIARRLIERGDTVILFNRGNHKLDSELEHQVRTFCGDRRDARDLARVAALRPNCVFDMCCYEPGQASTAVSLFSQVSRYIYMSSAAAYRTPRVFPIQEDNELGPWPIWGDYGLNKAMADNVFICAGRDAHFPVSIMRPTYILGPGNHIEREAFFLSRLERGLPVILPGSGRSLVQFAFAADVAEAAVRLSEIVGMEGEAFNCAGDQFVSLIGFVELCGRLIGKEARFVLADIERFGIPQSPYLPIELSPFADEHFVVANSKLKNVTGMSFKTIEAGMEEVLQWFLSARDRLPFRLRSIESTVLLEKGFVLPTVCTDGHIESPART